MASAKDTFESVTFGAMSFACGTWRGLGVSVAVTLEGIWGDVQHIAADRTSQAIHADRLRTATKADRARIEVKG